jgi:ribonuclease III
MRLRLGRSPYRELEKRLGYAFRKQALIEAALTHRSYRFEVPGVTEDNQRLEFLGDAVLGLVTASHLYMAHRDHDEGGLTDLRSSLTSGKALAQIGRGIELGDHVRMGRGEEQSGGRYRPSLVADALEAVIGAAYLDGGMKAVEKIFRTLFAPLLEAGARQGGLENPKGRLQELSQNRYHREPVYHCVREEGPPHHRMYVVEVVVNGAPKGQGTASSRRVAEAEAARQAVRALMKESSENGAP